MTRNAAISSERRRPEEHPDSVLPDDDTVRDEESTPLDHGDNEGIETTTPAELPATQATPRRRTR